MDRLTASLIVAAWAALPAVAQASVQDYQIMRLLSYHSDCQLAGLERRPATQGTLRYFARCANESFYPDGVEIECADPDDERSCRILTEAKSFDQLHLLDRRER